MGHRSIALNALEAACVGVLMAGLFADNLFTKSFWLAWILLAWAMYSEKPKDEPSDGFVQRI